MSPPPPMDLPVARNLCAATVACPTSRGLGCALCIQFSAKVHFWLIAAHHRLACGGYYELHGRPRPVCYSMPVSCAATNAVAANEDSQQDDPEDVRGEFVDRDDGDVGAAQESEPEPGIEGGEGGVAGQAGTARTQPNSDEDD